MRPLLKANEQGSKSSYVEPLLVGALVIAIFCLARRPFPVGVAQDDGLYVVLGKALAAGRGLRFINLPGAPADVHYPPGYPFLLALLSSVSPSFPSNATLFALTNIVLLGAASIAFVLLARRIGLPQWAGGAAALIGFVMPPALWMGTALLSEPLWLALTFWWLLWVEGVAERPRIAPVDAIGIGLTAGAIMLVRTQAVSGLVAVLCVLALRRRWTAALLIAAGAVVLALPWQLWVATHAAEIPAPMSAKYGPYASWYVDGLRESGVALIAGALQRNIASTASIVGGMFALPTAAWLGVLLCIMPAIAAVPRLARRAPVTLVLMVANAAIVLLWPYEPRRFVWTSWPFIALWLAAGFTELMERVRNRRMPRAFVIADGALMLVGAALTTTIILRTGAYRAIATSQARRIETAIAWVKQHADSAAVIASEDETAIYLYTGHLGVPTSTFSAAAYARGDEWNPDVFPDIVRRYSPDLAILSWKATVTAALGLTTGPQPVLQLTDHAGPSAVFARVRSARAVRD